MIKVNPGQVIMADEYRHVKDQAYAQYNNIIGASYSSTKPSSRNDAYRPHYHYNFTALKAQVGEVITAYKINTLSSTIEDMRVRDCVCDCNYCTCNCNYCGCNCDYCSCDCNYDCKCNCAYCTCDCHHRCTCACNY